MNMQDLKGKTVEELKSQLFDLKKESFNLRFQKATGELEKTSRIREVRRTIARINTILTQKSSLKEIN